MRQPNRRDMLKTSAAVGAGFWLGTSPEVRAQSPNEKLNVACIGVGGQGGYSVNGVKGENVVAVCDVDEVKASRYWRGERSRWFFRSEDAPKSTVKYWSSSAGPASIEILDSNEAVVRRLSAEAVNTGICWSMRSWHWLQNHPRSRNRRKMKRVLMQKKPSTWLIRPMQNQFA